MTQLFSCCHGIQLS